MNNSNISIVFIGCGAFALPSLVTLCQLEEFDVRLVVSQPDRRAGRSGEIKKSKIKLFCEQNDLDLFQEEDISELTEDIVDLEVDFIVVCDFGQMIPDEIIDAAEIECINIHPSLLPKYRGATPMQEALKNGDQYSGISYIKMTKKLDAGPVYFLRREEVNEDEDYISLSEKFAGIAAMNLAALLPQIKFDGLKPLAQDDSKAVYCKELMKNDGEIKWGEMNSNEIVNMLKAYKLWPGIYTFFKSKRLKILDAVSVNDIDEEEVPGKIISVDGCILVSCEDGFLEIKEVQLEGKKAIKIEEFVKGYAGFLGSILG